MESEFQNTGGSRSEELVITTILYLGNYDGGGEECVFSNLHIHYPQ